MIRKIISSMRNQSFRSIITFSLILVITIVSFSAFNIYSTYLNKKIYAESERNVISALVALDLFKDQFYCTTEEHEGKIIETMIQRMDPKDQVLNSFIFDARGDLSYSLHEDLINAVPFSPDELASTNEGVNIKSYPSEEPPFSRAVIHMHNSPSCVECHSPDQEHLGYVVIDISMNEQKGNTGFIHRSSVLYSLIMVVVIIILIVFMHYRFVRKSLREFNHTINKINTGNLHARLSIPETKELGRLGKSFNEMLDTFQMTQKELQEYHKKELRNNYKLATIGEMSAQLAHEIRNPITGIANATEIIAKETRETENKPILEEIQRQAKRVDDAISSLLRYSRKREMNLAMNNINEVIQQLVLFLRNQIKEKEIQFSLELSGEVPHFRFDHEQMEDVLLNLGLNAIQAIPKKGSVIFKTKHKPSENKVYIYVSDTGIGIPVDDLSNIFHPFFTTRSEGTGLGLAIVKDIIDKHEGEIWVENNKPRGCTFTISLPAEL